MKPASKTYKINIPKFFQEALDNSSLTSKQKSQACDCYFLITEKIVKGKNTGELFNMSSIVLKERYGVDYKLILNFLTDNNILITDNQYTVGKKSKSYGLSPKIIFELRYNYNYIISYHYVFESWFKKPSSTTISVKELDSTNFPSEVLKQIGTPVLSSVKKEVKVEKPVKEDKQILRTTNIILKQLEFDSPAIEKYFDTFVVDSDYNAVKLNYNRNAINRLIEKNIYANRNETNYRLDTNITNLDSNLLEFITLDGEKLVNIDLTNSQPTFLLKVLEGALFKGQVKEVDYKKFKNLVISGKLYEYVMEKASIVDRKEAKISTFHYLYSHESTTTTAGNVFKKDLPSIYSWIKKFKQSEGYSKLAISMQLLESELFIDTILKRLLKEGFKCLTKHDSVLCKQADLERVLSIVVEELDKFFGKEGYKLNAETKKETTEENKISKFSNEDNVVSIFEKEIPAELKSLSITNEVYVWLKNEELLDIVIQHIKDNEFNEVKHIISLKIA